MVDTSLICFMTDLSFYFAQEVISDSWFLL